MRALPSIHRHPPIPGCGFLKNSLKTVFSRALTLALLSAFTLSGTFIPTARSANEEVTLNDDPIKRLNSLKTSDGLSAQFWLTCEEQLFTTWARSGAIRNLQPIEKVKRNTPIYLALFLCNPGIRTIIGATSKHSVSRSCDITYDLAVVSPKKVLNVYQKGRKGCLGEPPTPGLIFLAADRAVFNFETIDPLGEYTVIVMIHDNIRQTKMQLVRTVELTD